MHVSTFLLTLVASLCILEFTFALPTPELPGKSMSRPKKASSNTKPLKPTAAYPTPGVTFAPTTGINFIINFVDSLVHVPTMAQLDEAKRAVKTSKQTSELVETPGRVETFNINEFEPIEIGIDIKRMKVETAGADGVSFPRSDRVVIDLSNLKRFEERLGHPTFIGYHGSITPLRADANGLVTQDLEAYANEVSDERDELGPGLYATYDKETAEFFATIDTHTYRQNGGQGFIYEIYIMPASKPLVVKRFENVANLPFSVSQATNFYNWKRVTSIDEASKVEEKIKEYMEDFDVLTAPHFITPDESYRITQQTKVNPRLLSQKGRVVMRLVEAVSSEASYPVI
jgi:hypothetical protein